VTITIRRGADTGTITIPKCTSVDVTEHRRPPDDIGMNPADLVTRVPEPVGALNVEIKPVPVDGVYYQVVDQVKAVQGGRPISSRPVSSWRTMNAPARAFSILGVVALMSVFTLVAALVVGGLVWLVQIVWGAVL